MITTAKTNAFVLVFGSNREGQAGVGSGSDDSDCISSPTPIHAAENSQFFPSPPISISIDPRTVSRVVTGSKQTFMLTVDGSVLCCGENDNNELGRNGKRSVMQRMDAVEAFSIIDMAVGDGFCILLSKDGRMISWGQNSFGQLGCGDREPKEKPKPNSFSTELRLLKVCAGSQHVLALARNGQVLTWGANRKGQLGNGQISSSCTPVIVNPLLHRPVIAIACGESHCLALTIGGNVYSWGDNSNGQLGTGDTSHRLRPELIRYLRAAKVKLISAGRQHSMAVSYTGLLFAFGSNSHGQCGLGDSADTDIRILAIPVVVEKLQSLSARVESVCCGSAHTLVLCSVPTKVKPCIYVMGLNSSGQLGLGKCGSVYRPTQIPLPEEVIPIGISTGPLSFHSFAFTEGVSLNQAYLPSIDLPSLRVGMERLRAANQRYGPSSSDTSIALKSFRQQIADAFSSVSVLNASFRVDATAKDGSKSGSSNLGLSIDLEQVRRSYDLIFSIDNEQVIGTLGRATLQLAEHLKECPFDDQENLSVFLIVLENPLMLRSSSFHVAIEQFLNGMLALPKAYQVILFGWYRQYKSEYFSRAVQVLQEYINFALTSKASGINPIHAVLVMHNLHHSNKMERIVPERQFYNHTVSQTINLLSEWDNFKASGKNSQVFNYFSYPFLIGLNVKYAVLQRDFQEQKNMQIGRYLNQFLGSLGSTPVAATSLKALFPQGVKVTINENHFDRKSADAMWWIRNVTLHLEIIVRRDYLLFDLIICLAAAFESNPRTFRLPLKVHFAGEDAVDHGGVAKELFTLAIKRLCKETGILHQTSDGRSVWFSHNWRMHGDFIRRGEQFMLDQQLEQHSPGGGGGSKSFLEILISLSHFKLPQEFSDSPVAKVAKTSATSPPFHSADANAEIRDNVFCVSSRLLGLLVGLASYHGILVDLPLPSIVYLIMEGGHSTVLQSLELSDLYAVDATLARSMKFILDFEEGSIEEAIGATFSASSNPLLQHIEVESGGSTDKLGPSYIDLKPNGEGIFVDRSNRGEFVQLFVRHALYGCCSNLVDSYLEGLQSLFAGDVLGLCSHEEIELLICGTRDIGDLSELRLRTVYGGELNDEHAIIHWFWDILSDMHNFEKRDFLRFVTGSDRVPVGGISKLGLQIRSTPQPSTTLPTSFTCFNILVLPSTYESKQQMKEKLYLSFRHCEGFGFS